MSASALASPKKCLDEDSMRDIQDAFEITTINEQNFKSCEDSTHLYKVFDSLGTLKSITFEGSLKAPLNQSIINGKLWDYLTKRANKIVDETKESSPTCEDGFAAYVYASDNDGVIHLCESFYDEKMSLFDRIGMFMHEVRHFDGHTHVTCNRGPRKGQANSCDNKISEKGSYAVSVEISAKMAMLAKNLTPSTKSMLKFATISWIDSSINEPVFPKGYSAVYMQNKEKAFIYDGTSKPLPAAVVPMTGKLISRRQGVVFFPDNKSEAYAVDFFTKKFHKLKPEGSLATKYNKLSKSDRQQIVDISNGIYSTCSVEGRVLNCTHYDEKDSHERVTLLNFDAEAVYESNEIGLNNREYVYIKSTDHQLYRMHVGKDGATPILITNALKGFRTMGLIDEKHRVGLSDTGEFQIFNKNSWQTHPELSSQRFDIMTKPFYWTEELYQ